MNDKELSLFLLCGLVVIAMTGTYQRTRFIEDIDNTFRIIMMSIVMSIIAFLGYRLTKIAFPAEIKKNI